MPSDAELMKIAIDDLNNSSLFLEDRLRALEELLTLVEPIDNANDVRKLAAWILGKACQNNPVVQKQVLDFGILAKLLEMVKSDAVE
uniref:Nucleotide exchange factor Fes1 domain-containing protein n=1 Tax=Chenopodium quinoa TaxID=63459 RepID=A0A803N2F1_CHEQI